MRPIASLLALCLFALFSVPGSLQAQNDDTRGVAEARSGSGAPDPGRLVVAAIGIDAYRYWPRLENAVSDAVGTQQLLIEKFGFEAPLGPLTDEAATKVAIEHYIDDRLRNVLQEDDSLVLIFAGHGHTRSVVVGDSEIATGYMVPVEARIGVDERWSDYVRIESFLEEVATLPARHILVLLDSCHSGFALDGIQRKTRSGLPRYEASLQQRPSRRVITSARQDEEAIDSGPVPRHSLFTGALVEGLDRGLADLDDSEFITSSEIGLYLQQRVASHSRSRQTPDFGAFDFDQRGEMVIPIAAGNTTEAIERRAFSALRRGELALVRELVDELQRMGVTGPRLAYLDYRLRVATYDASGAIESLQRIDEMEWSAASLPLSRHDVRELLVRSRFWQTFLAIAEDDGFPLDVSFLGDAPDGVGLAAIEITDDRGFEGYEIVSGGRLALEIANPTDRTWHVYMMDIDQDGRITPIPLWDSATEYDGIAAGRSERSFVFRHDGEAPGMSELRLYASPEPIRRLLSPPATAARGLLPAMDEASSRGVRVKSVIYRAVTPLIPSSN